MSIRIELIRKSILASGIRKMLSGSADEIIAIARRFNAKNHIPEIRDLEIKVTRTEVCGCPVLRMRPRSEKDVFIPALFMRETEAALRHGDDTVPDYMIYLQRGDFTNCPKATLIYGGNETFCGIAPSIEAALNRYGAAHETIVGEGLFHCYPFFPVAKETRDGYDLLIRILNKD